MSQVLLRPLAAVLAGRDGERAACELLGNVVCSRSSGGGGGGGDGGDGGGGGLRGVLARACSSFVRCVVWRRRKTRISKEKWAAAERSGPLSRAEFCVRVRLLGCSRKRSPSSPLPTPPPPPSACRRRRRRRRRPPPPPPGARACTQRAQEEKEGGERSTQEERVDQEASEEREVEIRVHARSRRSDTDASLARDPPHGDVERLLRLLLVAVRLLPPESPLFRGHGPERRWRRRNRRQQ